MFKKVVKKMCFVGLGVAAGLIFMIGIMLPEEVQAGFEQELAQSSGETMITEGCFFDDSEGKLRITEEFDWNKIIRPSGDMDWDWINSLKTESVITAEIDLTGTIIFLENESEYEKDFGHCICFRDFINLETIHFTGNIDTRMKISLYRMFGGCSKLKSCDFSGFSGANVVDMNGMFSGCSSLTSLDLRGFNTSYVTDMASMFRGCISLKNIDLRGFDTSSVTDMGGMFWNCSSLITLDLESFDTSNVQYMGSMFRCCSSLTSLDLRNFNTSNVQHMGAMFSDCSSLMSLDLSNFDTSNVWKMSDMFSGCSSLTSLDLSNFDTSNVVDLVNEDGSIESLGMSQMFEGCSSLRSLDLSSFDTSNMQYMIDMFEDCSSLISLNLSSFNTTNMITMSQMFSGCSSLIRLDLSNFDTSNVVSMYCMFRDCSSLKSIDLSSFDTSNVRSMLLMFDGCSSLTSLNLSNFNTSNVTSMGGMFQKCNSLKQLDISNFDFGKTEIDSDSILYLFLRMDSIEQIKVPANLPYAIDLPYSLTLPDTTESYWTDTSGKECIEIQPGLSTPMTYYRKLRIAPGNTTTQQSQKTPLAKGKTFTDSKTKYKYKVTGSYAERPTAAFAGTAKKSKKITIPPTVTYQGVIYQVTSVWTKALKNNTKVTSLTIGNNISRIEKNAFAGCRNLKKITIKSEGLSFVGKNALKGIHKKCRIKVPSSKLKEYQKLFQKKGQKSTVKIRK